MLLVVSLAVCGPLCVVFGALGRPAPHLERSGRHAEVRAWRRLWIPLVPACVALAVLVGWALQEADDTGDALDARLLVAAIPGAVIAARALARAIVSLLPARKPLVATVGLVRPKVIIDGAIASALPSDALDAVRAHEAAHAAHRDPLQIWLAQLATDLQWPAPSARLRFRQWLHALEVARDEEARESGACGHALASAIVTVAQLAQARARACAALIGQGELLRDRIARLLRPIVVGQRSISARVMIVLVMVLVVTGIAVGAVCGDHMLRCLPGVS